MEGWIKLHRQILGSAIFENPNLLKVWIWCLCKATHTPREAVVGLKVVPLEAGQFVYGRKAAAKVLGFTESSFYKYMKTLESVGMVSLNSNNKFTVATIEKWALYQSDTSESNSKGTAEEQQSNSKGTAEEQQSNTNKNVKNVKNVKNDKNIDYIAIKDAYNTTCPSLPQVRNLSEDRKKAIKARLNTYPLEKILEAFKKAEASDFLKGKNDSNWSANFDWIMSDKNMAKILDGNYDNKKGDKRNAGFKEPDTKPTMGVVL